jgi:hypothetical protein
MSAPAALAMAKLSYPETKVSIAMGKDVYTMDHASPCCEKVQNKYCSCKISNVFKYHTITSL